jgi:hypothetical protein
VNFEIRVDGVPVAQSGLMRAGDEPRLLVVQGLKNAKEVKLVTRHDRLANIPGLLCLWADAMFYK